ncbi:MAG: RluA family pseudouridine synthase [Parachlamydiales bacterium]
MKILYEDNHLLALDKPPGMLTQPSGTDQESLEALAKAYLKERDHKPGQVFLHALHRLDRAAEGIVLFAKSSKALERGMEAIREGKMEKVYLAWVAGDLGQEGVLEDYLIHREHRGEVVTPDTSGAKRARLRYLRKGPGLYEIFLETGRYHQIRVQFASHGAPIIGDTKYGGPPCDHPGIFLAHIRCTLPHPTQKTALTVEAPRDHNAWHA